MSTQVSFRRKPVPVIYTERQLIPLTVEQKREVERVAKRSGLSISELFRQGLELWIAQNADALSK